jgi:hypothetical protein
MDSTPETSAPALHPGAGAEPAPRRPFLCCAHCEHENGYVHEGGCADKFCTGYDERTPDGELP